MQDLTLQTKILLEKLKTLINTNTHHVHESEDSILLKGQFSEINLKVQSNLHQNSSGLILETWQADSKTYVELQRIQDSQKRRRKLMDSCYHISIFFSLL